MAMFMTLQRPLLSLLLLGGLAGPAHGNTPEDILKGSMIVSDTALPTKWSSPDEYASRLKSLNKTVLSYDKKTGKARIYYAGFFPSPVNETQVSFVIYDVTNGTGSKTKKVAWETPLGRKGERVLFSSFELDIKKLEANRKYMFAIENKGKVLAYANVTVRG